MNYFYFLEGSQTPLFGPDIGKEDFLNRKDETIKVFDKAVFLSVLSKIWRETSLVLKDSALSDTRKLTVDSFWVENKYLLDYVNAVFNLKEFLENYDHVNDYNSDVYLPFENAFININSWFRFICEFRNCLIHNSGLVKDIDMKGRLWVSIEEFIAAERDQLSHDLKKRKTGNKVKDRQDFISRLENMTCLRTVDGKRYEPAYLIAEKVDLEISGLLNSTYEALFNTKIKKAFNDLLSFVHHDESGYHKTVYVEEDFSYEPCMDVESYLMYFAVNAGPNSKLTNLCATYLIESGYVGAYAGKLTILGILETAREKGY